MHDAPDVSALIGDIRESALTLGLAAPERRDLLIVDATLRAAIPRKGDDRGQLLADLTYLAAERGPDGSFPLLVGWLDRAAWLLDPRSEAGRFRAWSAQCAGRPVGGARLRLPAAEPASPPERPYPLLLGCYEDRRLFAGRDRELRELRARVDRVAITCLWARSGAGKSSLLAAGLVPALRDARIPEVWVRGPHEVNTPAFLLQSLIDPAPRTLDPAIFVETLVAVHRLAKAPPVLILDQFEELFKGPGASAARARLAPYIAATIRPGPALGNGSEWPLCRWLLAYRHEFHGNVKGWLRDILVEARASNMPGLQELPHDMTVPGRCDEWELPPFGYPASGEPADGEALYASARAAFRAAIAKPLEFAVPRWFMSEADKDRLAHAFAAERVRDSTQPLLPELQVMLARLMEGARANEDTRLVVSTDSPLDETIRDALLSHARHCIEKVLPAGRPGVDRRRALLLTVLGRLVDTEGRRSQRIPVSHLQNTLRLISSETTDGMVLHSLTENRTRLLTVEIDNERGPCYALAHDRLAEIIARLTRDAPLATFDRATLDLVDFVQRRTELFPTDQQAALARDTDRFERLVDEPGLRAEAAQDRWWQAWSRHMTLAWQNSIDAQREARARRTIRMLTAGLVLALVLACTGLIWVVYDMHNEKLQAEQRSLRQRLAAEMVKLETEIEAGLELKAQFEVERQLTERLVHLADQLDDLPLDTHDPAVLMRLLGLLLTTGKTVDDVLARLDGISGTDPWAMMATEETRISPQEDVRLRLAWVEAWASADRIGRGATDALVRLERVGSLLATLSRIEPHASVHQMAAARAQVERTVRDLFGPAGGQRPPTISIPLGFMDMPRRRRDATENSSSAGRRITVAAPFRIARDQVTVADLRRLIPSWAGDAPPYRPVRGLSWFAALGYAAWEGGRLASADEWHYAAYTEGRTTLRFCRASIDLNAVPTFPDVHVGSVDNSNAQLYPLSAVARCPTLGGVAEHFCEWIASNARSGYKPMAIHTDGPPEPDGRFPPLKTTRVSVGAQRHPSCGFRIRLDQP